MSFSRSSLTTHRGRSPTGRLALGHCLSRPAPRCAWSYGLPSLSSTTEISPGRTREPLLNGKILPTASLRVRGIWGCGESLLEAQMHGTFGTFVGTEKIKLSPTHPLGMRLAVVLFARTPSAALPNPERVPLHRHRTDARVLRPSFLRGSTALPSCPPHDCTLTLPSPASRSKSPFTAWQLAISFLSTVSLPRALSLKATLPWGSSVDRRCWHTVVSGPVSRKHSPLFSPSLPNRTYSRSPQSSYQRNPPPFPPLSRLKALPWDARPGKDHG